MQLLNLSLLLIVVAVAAQTPTDNNNTTTPTPPPVETIASLVEKCGCSDESTRVNCLASCTNAAAPNASSINATNACNTQCFLDASTKNISITQTNECVLKCNQQFTPDYRKSNVSNATTDNNSAAATSAEVFGLSVASVLTIVGLFN